MENIQPHVVKKVGREIQEILQSNLEGIELIINDQDVTDVQAKIDGPPGTPYADGQFRVKLCLSSAYPQEPPKGFFITKIFHPNIAPSTGEICVNTMKRDWKPDLGIKHLLLTIKCLLIVPNAESALNEQAGKLLLEEYEEYARRARLFTEIHARPSASSTSSSCCPVASTHHRLAGDSGILRDTNTDTNSEAGSVIKKHSTEKDSVPGVSGTNQGPPAKKPVAANKKALKRL